MERKKKPNTREGEVIWLTKDEKALAIIALDLSNSHIYHINGFITAQEAWEHLESLFGQVSLAKPVLRYQAPPLMYILGYSHLCQCLLLVVLVAKLYSHVCLDWVHI